MTINPEMVTLAREASGLTQAALAHTVGISQGLMSRIEHGFDEPSSALVAKLVVELGVPADFFSRAEQVVGAGVVDFFHRKRLTLPAKPLKRAHAQVGMMRMEIIRLLASVEWAEVSTFPHYPIEEHESPAEIARLVRASWRVPDGPLPDLVALSEATGTPVLFADLHHEKLAAMSMPGLVGRHLVVMNDRLPPSNQRWSLAHELGHLVMHGGVLVDDMEREADQFASELLLPADDVRPDLRGLRFEDLGELKAVWHVSLAALIRTAYNLGEISDHQYKAFNVRLSMLPGGRKREPGEFTREEPRLIRMVIRHLTQELGYTPEQIAQVMGCTHAVVRARYLDEPRATMRVVGGRTSSGFGPARRSSGSGRH